jgi:hypothetical protein
MRDGITGVSAQSAFDDQVTFLIKKGVLEDDSDEFITFKR